MCYWLMKFIIQWSLQNFQLRHLKELYPLCTLETYNLPLLNTLLEHRRAFSSKQKYSYYMYSTYLHEKENISQNIFLDALLVSCLCALQHLIAECTKVYEFRLDSCSAFSVVVLAIQSFKYFKIFTFYGR